jgi:pimeloyl-ACP methyl ester carboxylesterase
MNFLRHEYDQVSPDGPDHFPVVYEKTIRMLETEPDLDLGDLNATDVPTLVLQGDRDEVTLDHSLAVVDALRNARLAVLPGTHLLPAESPDVVNPLLISFLRGGPGAPSWSSSTEGE